MENRKDFVLSPVTNSKNNVFIKSLCAKDIILDYKKKFNLEVRPYFQEVDEINVYKCVDSGLYFFHPQVVGDGFFYKNLYQSNLNYFPNDKWEFNKALEIIGSSKRVLEIGAGKGAFLRKLKSKDNRAIGLELHESEQNDIVILSKDIVDYSKFNLEKFGVVCSFQVMEHIPNLGEVLRSSIDLLRKDGLLIISVPNHDGYLGYIRDVLDLPPHHQTWWTEDSGQKIARLLDLDCINIYREMLSGDQVSFIISHYLDKFGFKKSLNLLSKVIIRLLHLFRIKIPGHTIMFIFRK